MKPVTTSVGARQRVKMPAHEHQVIRAVMLHKPLMSLLWEVLSGTSKDVPVNIVELVGVIRNSMPVGVRVPVEAHGHTAFCTYADGISICPQLRLGESLYGGRVIEGAELVNIIAGEMQIRIKGIGEVYRYGGMHTKLMAMAKKALAVDPADGFSPPPPKAVAKCEISSMNARFMAQVKANNAAMAKPAKVAKRKHGHQGGLVLEDGTMVADPARALEELHDQANAPGITYEEAKAIVKAEGRLRSVANKGGQYENFIIQTPNAASGCGPIISKGTEPLRIMQSLQRAHVALPPKVEAKPAKSTGLDFQPAADHPTLKEWVPPAPAKNLADLAAPYGTDRRQREVIKKRFTTIFSKMGKLDKIQRAALIQYIQTQLP